MRGKQAIFILEIKKKSGLSINPDIHHSKVFSSAQEERKEAWLRRKSHITTHGVTLHNL